jgi:hypothetical protein
VATKTNIASVDTSQATARRVAGPREEMATKAHDRAVAAAIA